MAPTLYPRGTVKKIVKAHSNRQMSKNVDILVRLVDTGEPKRNGKPCKKTRLTCNTDLPQLCVVHARVRTDHLTIFHYVMATRRPYLALRYAMGSIASSLRDAEQWEGKRGESGCVAVDVGGKLVERETWADAQSQTHQRSEYQK